MSIFLPENVWGPVLDLELPPSADAIDIVVRNVTTGKTLALNLPAAWGGDDLVLDFPNRTIRDQSGADRSGLLSPSDNELWTPVPMVAGENEMEVEARSGEVQSETKSAPAVAENQTINEGNIPWQNPGNAKAQDATYATAPLTNASGASRFSQYLLTRDYGFALPPSVVNGIRISYLVKMSGQSGGEIMADNRSRVVRGGVVQSASDLKSGSTWPETPGSKVYGGPTQLWGLTDWVYTHINAAGFGAAISAWLSNGSSLTAEIDSASITVYYLPILAYGAVATLRWERGYY